MSRVEISKENALKCASTIDYIWDVKNLTDPTKSGKFLSPIFHGDSKDAEKWMLGLKVGQDTEDTDKRVAVSLYLMEPKSAEEVKAEFQLNFLNSDNKIIDTASMGNLEFQPDRGSPRLVLYKCLIVQLSAVLIDGSNVRIHGQISRQNTLNLKRKCEDEEERSVKKQFRSLFINGDFADVILKTENTSFPASKLILAAHSPVFSAMFSSGMLESAESIVKIEDFSDEIVKAFLEFVYTGDSPILEENPEDLLKISDKYQVMGLKKEAESVLLRKLAIQNAVEILILAHFHSPTTFKPKVISFVTRNSKEVQQTEAFKEMAMNFPQILLDLYKDISSAEKENKS